MAIKNKLVIVGAGNVGSAVLNRAIDLHLAAEIAVIDIQQGKAAGEALDASHATPCIYSPGCQVYAAGYETCKDARLIIIAAGIGGRSLPPLPPGEAPDRLRLAGANIQVIQAVMTEIVKYTTEAVIIMITNPLDITTYYAANFFGYPQGRLLGTGTMLETLRLQRLLADHYRIDAKSVNAWMLGEHGRSAFAAWSLASVGGVPVQHLGDSFPQAQPFDPEAATQAVIHAASDVVSGKGWTNSGISMAACRVAKAVLFNERAILPVSTTLRGEYGITDVALSLPSLVAENGVEHRLAVPLSEDEVRRLRASAATLAGTLRQNHILNS
ncbi:MAG: L-lactate dehydrogenase [Sporomusaceae bacterium]|nr:L-lactate dehydrogenase [Sporomusaceae bacterium]